MIIIYRIYAGSSTDYMSVLPKVNLSGEVRAVEETASSLAVTIADVSVLNGTEIHSYEKILCYIKSEKSIVQNNDLEDYSNKFQEIKIGNQIQISGSATSFTKPSNDGQFNQYSYYREKDYAYMVYTDEYSIVNSAYNFKELLRRLSAACIAVYKRFLPESDAGIISAMIFGKKSLLVEDDRELYKINGLMHILAISGMHISIVSMILIFIIIRLPIEYKTGRIVIFIILFIYGLMTGFGVSCVRAVIMFGTKLLAELSGRVYDVLSSLSLSAIITLLINPRVLFHCDFILSYLAVIAISIIYPVFAEKFQADKGLRQVVEKLIIKPFILSMCTWVITMPAVLYFYYEVPLYSIVINLLILPFVTVLFIVSWLMIPVSLFAPVLTSFLAGSIHTILEFYRELCDFCIEYVYDFRIVGFPSVMKIVLCYFIILLSICIYRKMKKNIFRIILLALFVFLPVCIMNYQRTGDLKISFLDVGQGDCAVMTLPDGKVICIDCGSSDVDNLSKYRLEPFLCYNGIKNIDCFILTHIDKDHYSGLLELMERKKYNGVDIGVVVIANSEICKENFGEVFDKDENSYLNYSIKVECIEDGQEIIYGDVKLKCLNPIAGYDYDNQNDSSVVLKMSYDDFDALFTGDISKEVEESLVEEKLTDDKNYDILKVAHHGSKESSGEFFLQAIKPEVAIISCGKNISYGHPHKEVLERFDEISKKVYVTAECGQVTVKESKGKVTIYY